MDSVTRPVGHLPPSVYWRRRAIVLVGLAVLIALVAWACTAGGGGGDDKKNASADGSSAPPSTPASPGIISPGAPSNGAPVVPGAASGGTTGGSGAPVVPGAASGGTAGGSAGGSAGTSGTTTGTTAGAANGGATGTTGQGQAPQPGAANGGATGGNNAPGLLMCQAPTTVLKLTGDRPENTRYRVGEQVNLKLEIVNNGTQTCAVDMAQTSATVTIRSGNDTIWSPSHCASNAPLITQIQPGKSIVHSWTWNWTRSDPARCSGPVPTLATPAPGALFVAKGTVSGNQWASNEYKWLVAE